MRRFGLPVLVVVLAGSGVGSGLAFGAHSWRKDDAGPPASAAKASDVGLAGSLLMPDKPIAIGK